MNIRFATVQTPKEIRAVYQETLNELIESNPSILVMDADLAGASGVAKVFKNHPDRCINMGISEANMVSAAAGMSLTGKIPFIHTFAPFATRRVFDQLYMSGVYQRANLKIYGSDPGFWAAHNGGTHTSMEDLAMTRALPNITIFAPSDATQFKWCMKEAAAIDGVVYIRATRKVLPDIYDPSSEFETGKAIVVAPGSDIVIYAIGEMVSEALNVRTALATRGISVEVVDCFSVKPLDEALIRSEAVGKKLIVTAENHNKINGLGCAVAHALSEVGHLAKQLTIAVDDRFGEVGTTDYLMDKFELTSRQIEEKILRIM